MADQPAAPLRDSLEPTLGGDGGNNTVGESHVVSGCFGAAVRAQRELELVHVLGAAVVGVVRDGEGHKTHVGVFGAGQQLLHLPVETPDGGLRAWPRADAQDGVRDVHAGDDGEEMVVVSQLSSSLVVVVASRNKRRSTSFERELGRTSDQRAATGD